MPGEGQILTRHWKDDRGTWQNSWHVVDGLICYLILNHQMNGVILGDEGFFGYSPSFLGNRMQERPILLTFNKGHKG